MSLIAQVAGSGGESQPEASKALKQWEPLVGFWKDFEWADVADALSRHVHSRDFWIDLSAVVACFLVAAVISLLLRRSRALKNWYPVVVFQEKMGAAGKFPFFLVAFALLLWLAAALAGFAGYNCPVLKAVTVIYTAYLAFHLPSMVAPGKWWIKPMAALVITAAALHMLGVLNEVVETLDNVTIPIGKLEISVLSLILAPAVFLVLYGIGRLITGFTDRRMAKRPEVPPTVRVLTTKVMQLVMILLAIGVTLGAVGINLTAITVFGGALGLGVGFGLQKVVSNLISGVIILLDRSIKPGDVIEIGDAWGVINGLRTRYVSVMTRDKKEILIPNEDFITQSVINWSFSDRLVRYRVPFGVSYDSDVREAIRLAEEAAAGQIRVRKDPAPSCRMRGFGDSSIDLELRFWVVDPGEGRGNIISEVLLSIWDAYKENGIEIPYPRRELYLHADRKVVHDLVSPESPDPS